MIFWLTCHVNEQWMKDVLSGYQGTDCNPLRTIHPASSKYTGYFSSSQQPGLGWTPCSTHASPGNTLTDRQLYQAIFGKQEAQTDECVSAETFKTCLLPCLERVVLLHCGAAKAANTHSKHLDVLPPQLSRKGQVRHICSSAFHSPWVSKCNFTLHNRPQHLPLRNNCLCRYRQTSDKKQNEKRLLLNDATNNWSSVANIKTVEQNECFSVSVTTYTIQ